MKKLSSLIALTLLLVTPSFAQDSMGLYLASRYGGSPLEITELSMDVSIVGDRAITTLDFTFYNKLDNVLEGEFKFPLQSGQSVYRLALEIGNQLREAVIVEKNKGRESFEQIVRRKFDPALLEQTAGNIYTTKIYPIPGKGTRRVVIGLEESLVANDDSYSYEFPLNFSGMVGQFKLSINSDSSQKPEAKLTSSELSFKLSDSLHSSSLTQTQFAKGQNLEILIPRDNTDSVLVRLEEDRATGGVYFWSKFPLAGQSSDKGKNPEHVLLLWDNSYSGLHRDHAGDKNLVLNYLKTLAGVTVDLIRFNIEADLTQRFDLSKSGISELDNALDNIQYDGGTRWNSLSLGNIETDRIILVSDGIGTLGDYSPELPKAPIYVINSSVEADHNYLESLSQGTGGAYINRTRIQGTDAEAILGHITPFVHSITTKSGKVEDLVFGTSQETGTQLWVAGRLKSSKAELTITAGRSSANAQSYSVTLDKVTVRKSKGVIQRAWARAMFSKIETKKKEDRKQAIRFAMNNKIVTPLTSLIVLENINDYVRFEIEPPKELMPSYKRMMSNRVKQEFDLEEKLEGVVSLWKERIEWYETDFSKPFGTAVTKQESGVTDLAGDLSVPWAAPPGWSGSSELAARSGSGAEGNFSEPAADSIPNPHPDIHLVPPQSSHFDVREDENGEDVYFLSPFMVEESDDIGYMATTTLAGSRLRTNFRDVGTSSSVVTSEFMEDTGATDTMTYVSSIELVGVVSDEEYFYKLKEASDAELVELYFNLRETYATTPSYFFDAASVFVERGMTNIAVRVLSSVADLVPGDYLYQRALGRTFVQMGAFKYAIEALEATLAHRTFEPQSYFDLGLAYEAAGRTNEALKSLYHIIEMPFSDRFDEVDLIALMEINRILDINGNDLEASFVDKRLIYPMPMDLRVTLSWNTDDTDVDLHVTNPSGNKCYYRNPLTAEGGLLSRDLTEGYGPEEFLLRNAHEGSYVVQAHYFGSNEQGENLPVVLSVQITKNFGRPTEESKTITLRLEDEDEIVHLGEIAQVH